MTTRFASSDDIEFLLDLFCELDVKHLKHLPEIKAITADKNYRRNYLLENVIPDENKLLAIVEDQGKIIGTGMGIIQERKDHIVFKDLKYGLIADLVVSNKHKRKGAGKILMEFLEKELKERGCSQIELTVYQFNEEAMSFYEKLGYSKKMVKYVK